MNGIWDLKPSYLGPWTLRDWDTIRIMENHMDKTMNNDMETGVTEGYVNSLKGVI